MITKTTMVLRQPPPNFEAPYPEINPLNKLFILGICYFFRKRMKINAITAITATTRKMPKPIPVLKIATIAEHELTINDKNDNSNTAIILE
jgi:hypothetical protein